LFGVASKPAREGQVAEGVAGAVAGGIVVVVVVVGEEVRVQLRHVEVVGVGGDIAGEEGGRGGLYGVGEGEGGLDGVVWRWPGFRGVLVGGGGGGGVRRRGDCAGLDVGADGSAPGGAFVPRRFGDEPVDEGAVWGEKGQLVVLLGFLGVEEVQEERHLVGWGQHGRVWSTSTSKDRKRQRYGGWAS
jgi:hypothetical protein